MGNAVPVEPRLEAALLELEGICHGEVMNRDAVRENIQAGRTFLSVEARSVRRFHALSVPANQALRILRAALRHGFDRHARVLVERLAAVKSHASRLVLLSLLLREGISGPLLDKALEARLDAEAKGDNLEHQVMGLLARAAEAGNIDGARALAAQGYVSKPSGHSPVVASVAAHMGQDAFLLAFLEEYPALSAYPSTLRTDQLEAVRQGILLAAVCRCMPATVKRMLDRYGFSPREKGTVACRDVELPREAALPKVLSDRAQTPLAAAVAAGRREMAELLLARGGILRALNAAGETPLHVAASAGNLDGVRLGIDLGLDVQARDLDDRTPFLAWAESLPETASAREVERGMAGWKALGACLEDTDSIGYGAVLLAARGGRFAQARGLMRGGARLPLERMRRKLSGAGTAWHGYKREEIELLLEEQERIDAARALGIGMEAPQGDGFEPSL